LLPSNFQEDLIEAIKSNDPKKTEQLLSEGVDANCRDASSPVSVAIEYLL
jgi:hypothetical protein